MTLRGILIQTLAISGSIFFFGAWSVASLNAQMRAMQAESFEAQLQLVELASLEEAVNRAVALRERIPSSLIDAIAASPTSFDCCSSGKALVLESIALLVSEEDRDRSTFRLAEAWTQLNMAQVDRLKAEHTRLQTATELRNWLVPLLAMLLLALSLGIAWYRVKMAVIDPVEAVSETLASLSRGGDVVSIDLANAPKELQLFNNSLVDLIVSHREVLRTRNEDLSPSDISKQSDSAELQFQKLVEIASKPAFVLDASGAVRSWNTLMVELTGAARARVNKMRFADEFLRGESHAIFEEAFGMTRSGGFPDEFRCELWLGNRLITDVTIHLSPQVDSALGVNRVLGVLDVGTRETSIRDFKGDLKASKTERLITEVSGSLQLLEPASAVGEADEAEQQRQLKALKSAVSWIGRQSYERKEEALDLAELVDHFVASMVMHLDEKGIELRLQTFEGSALVLGNASAFIEILKALIGNAEDAIEMATSYPKTIDLKIWERDNQVFTRVLDSGSGLQNDSAFSPLLPFATTKSDAGHLGLGLTHARDLVEEMNGSITIESSETGFGIVISLPKYQDAGTA